MGRAPRTKKILPDFREECRVTRHSRVFHGLTVDQRTPRFWGITKPRSYKLGDLVLKKFLPTRKNPSHGKLGPNWEGPYNISRII